MVATVWFRGTRYLGDGLVRRLALLVQFTAVLTIVHGTVWFEKSSAAQDSLVNCNQLEPEDRCDCNMRVLRALNGIRVIVSDPVQSPNSTPANIQDAVQQERLHRLRTFIAPHCEQPSTGERLPLFNEHSASSSIGGILASRLQPLATRPIHRDALSMSLLPGRWEGWQTLADGKSSPISIHVIGIRDNFVRACTDQGMVFGVLRGDFLELPRPQSSGLAYSIRLWRGGPPNFRDLEGVALLDLRPNEWIVAGQVWLTRAQKLRSSLMPTGYFCEDRELEDRRSGKLPRE
jgi:hypothetical protein